MNPLRWLEEKAYLGEVIKDYGCIQDERSALGRTFTQVFLVRRAGKLMLAFKHSSWMMILGSTHYFYMEPDCRDVALQILKDVYRWDQLEAALPAQERASMSPEEW